jgi:hypothetical protein
MPLEVVYMETPVLTAEERHQLMSVLRDLDAQAPKEQRRHPRRRVQLNLEIQLVGKELCGIMSAKLINVAARGIGLELRRPLRIGRRFTVRLRFGEGGGWLVLCEVRNCAALEDGEGFHLGAEFVDRVDDPKGTARAPRKWTLPQYGLEG